MNNSFELSTIKSLLGDALAEKPGSYIVGEIFERFSTLQELMNVTELELLSIKGIGKMKSRQIMAALELSRMLNAPIRNNPNVIRSPQDAVELLIPRMRYLQQEHFVVIFLNTKNHVIGEPETISIGSLNAAIVHPREVFKAAIKRSAASIVVAHNHPSSDTTPSPEDIQLTLRLVEAGSIMGVEVLDHIIVGGNTFISLKERGHMTS